MHICYKYIKLSDEYHGKNKINHRSLENQMTRVKKLEVVCKLRINPSFKILTTETWTASKVSDNMLVKQILKHVGYLTHCDLTKEVFILFLDLTK